MEGFRYCEIDEGRLGDSGGLKPQYSVEVLNRRNSIVGWDWNILLGD